MPAFEKTVAGVDVTCPRATSAVSLSATAPPTNVVLVKLRRLPAALATLSVLPRPRLSAPSPTAVNAPPVTWIDEVPATLTALPRFNGSGVYNAVNGTGWATPPGGV